MKDLWTNSPYYRKALQSNDQVTTDLALLDLAGAESLVDVGCGNGAFAIEAARRRPNCRVIACDILESAVAECRKAGADLLGRNLEVLLASAESIPLPSRSVDRVLMRNVLHHLPDPRTALTKVTRLLTPSGLFLLEGPCNALGEDFAGLLSEIHKLMDDSHPRTYLTPARMQAVFEEQGLAVTLNESWPFPFRVGPEQVSLIQKHHAQDALKLHMRGDNSYIQMKIARLVAVGGERLRVSD